MKNTLKTCGQVRNYSGATWPKKGDVPERKLDLPESNKLFWMDIDFSKFNEYNL